MIDLVVVSYIFVDVDLLLSRYEIETLKENALGKRLESELAASGSDGFNNAADVVANQAEACRLALFLHRASESSL